MQQQFTLDLPSEYATILGMLIRTALEQLFRYDVLSDRPLSGGCGEIWRAMDLLFNRVVAVKTIKEGLLDQAPEKAQRTFVREATVGARLGEFSRHIVKVFDLGLVEGYPYFVMEWLDPAPGRQNIDLAEQAGSISLRAIKGIMVQVIDALSTAHSKGIVHSDVSPWNVVYDPRERIFKVSDFGLLRIVEQNLLSYGSGSLLKGGRPAFQPPEVLADLNAIGYSADVYALAVTFRVLVEGLSCLPSTARQMPATPGVLRIRHEQRDAPDEARQLVARFVDGHTREDSLSAFATMLQRVPG